MIEFVSILGTKTENETWSLYLTGCFQLLEESKTDKQREKRKQRVFLVLEEAKNVGHLTKQFWIKWVDLLLESDMKDGAIKIALDSTKAHPDEVDLLLESDMKDGAIKIALDSTKAHPDEVELWQKLLTLEISLGANLDLLKEILKDARERVPKKDLWPLVSTVLEFCISSLNNEETVKMLEGLLKDSFEISSPAKEIYLEYEYLSNGIAPTRGLYTRISQSPPVPVSFYKKYISFEGCQPKQDMGYIRRAFEDALQHHGKINPDLWLDYIKAETKYGKPEKAGSINMRAVKTLEGNHNQEFVSQFTLMQNTGRI